MYFSDLLALKSLETFLTIYWSPVVTKIIFSAKTILPNCLLHYLRSHKISDINIALRQLK